MATVTLRTRDMTVEIENGDAQLIGYVTQLLSQQAQSPTPIDIPAAAVQAVRDQLEETTGLSVVEIPPTEPPPTMPHVSVAPTVRVAGPSPPAPLSPGDGMARRAPRTENDPEIRDRQRQAAANAREALAAKRAAAKAEAEAATEVEAEPAKRGRGRPRADAVIDPVVATEDLSGDREIGDHEHGPDSEPADPHETDEKVSMVMGKMRVNGGTVPMTALTAGQKMQCCFSGLKDVAKVSESGMSAVKSLVANYGVSKIKEVPEERLDEFWADTETLCGTFNVLFPPADAAKV